MAAVEVLDGREAQVGKFTVRRVLPTRPLRTVGAWCFADHMGPAEVTETSGLDVGPHPHTGLQTVTWLMSGAALHKDSLGSEQLIRPGQLNLMTAGRGIVHAEEATGTYRGTLHGVQLWVAQPDDVRHGDPAFAHHGELPVVEHGTAAATVLAGSFLGATSPAAFVTDLLGLDVVVRPGATTLPLRTDFEHAVVALEGEVLVGGAVARPGQIASLGTGRDQVEVQAREEARLLVLGGVPFPEKLFMWWNFVGRTREEVSGFYADWRDERERFADVDSVLARIPAPAPPWEPAYSREVPPSV
ncbi:MAG: pirin family protein [Candidatus Nanopelagicales bacterium]